MPVHFRKYGKQEAILPVRLHIIWQTKWSRPPLDNLSNVLFLCCRVQAGGCRTMRQDCRSRPAFNMDVSVGWVRLPGFCTSPLRGEVSNRSLFRELARLSRFIAAVTRGGRRGMRGRSFWTDRPRCRPVGISNPFQRHLEEADRLLTRRDPFADLTQSAILDGCGVSNCHGTGRDLP